ncbi:hypothetical protein AB0395_02280 [Streptosporangium sp. NPDC051023]|uniref:hypothetical protein n=1 Tax=Streptosporangium sp. NPDC051023 TaxID=3155410 RepID=UPI00344E6A90
MRHAVGCALLILLLATACTTGGPTLDEASEVLAKDTEALKNFPLRDMKLVEENQRGTGDGPTCPEGTRRQTHNIIESFPAGGQTTPAAWIGAVKPSIHHTLISLGYEKNSGASQESPDRVILVLGKKNPGITFTILLQTSQPNIQVTGKTECLAEE